MCAEALWWRCHRSLISDYLKARGIEVIHISTKRKRKNIPTLQPRESSMGGLSYEGLL